MQQIITRTVVPPGAVRRSRRRGRGCVFLNPPPAGGKIKDAVGMKSTLWFPAVKRKKQQESKQPHVTVARGSELLRRGLIDE